MSDTTAKYRAFPLNEMAGAALPNQITSNIESCHIRVNPGDDEQARLWEKKRSDDLWEWDQDDELIVPSDGSSLNLRVLLALPSTC